MSDSDEQYTVVDELEEGEIVETVPSKTVRQSQSKKRKSNNVAVNIGSSENDNHCHHKKKKLVRKSIEIPKRYRSPVNDDISFTGMLSPKPNSKKKAIPAKSVNRDISFTSTLSPKPNSKKKAIPAKSVNREKNSSCNFAQTRTKPGTFNVPRRTGHVLREQTNPNTNDNSAQHLDLNSSYDDLLKHHMAIQKSLMELEKEHKKTKRNCQHKVEKKQTSSKIRRKSSSENSKKIIRVVEGAKNSKPVLKVPASSPAVVQSELSNKIEVVILDNRSHKSVPKAQSDRSDHGFENTSNIIVPMQEDTELYEPKNQDDDELDLLRRTALNTVVSPKAINAKKTSLENAPGFDKEITYPNIDASSSAFSMSGCHDNYSVIDMEVDEEDTSMSLQMEVLDTQCPHSSDDEDIALMREQLLQSLKKSNVVKQEPDSTTVSVEDNKISIESIQRKSINSKENHSLSPFLVLPISKLKSEVKPQLPDVAGFQSGRSSTGISPHQVQCADSSVLPSEICSIDLSSSDETGDKSVKLLEKSVSFPQFVSDNNLPPFAISSIVQSSNVSKAQEFLTKAASAPFDPWDFMKQKPVIINLKDDSSDSESSECEIKNEAPFFDSIEELIRSEKMKTTSKQVGGSYEKETAKIESEVVRNSAAITATRSTQSGSSPVSAEPVAVESGDSVAKMATKNTGARSAKAIAELIHEYKLLKRKLELTSDILQKETQVMAMRKIIANKKKSAFINSQIVTQRLKEQLMAAEKVRKTNMKMMFLANTDLEDIQGSVKNRTVLLKQMREHHQKLEEQISSSVPFPLDVILGSE